MKKIWIKNLIGVQKTSEIAEILPFFRFCEETAVFTKKAKKSPISLVFWTPMRFLIQIFFIGPEIHCILWKHMISRHCCSLLLITAHFHDFFLSSQHNFTCPGGKKKFSILLLPRNKVRHGLDWWCTCIRKAFKPKILGEGVFGNDWEKLEKKFIFMPFLRAQAEKFLYSFIAQSQKF